MRYDYYTWLIDLLGDDYLKRNYQKLLYRLFEQEFFWTIDYDSDRAEDGLHLRRLYTKETGSICSINRGCTILEMMVALCRKCENDIMYDPDLGDRSGYWFWVILENLGLDLYDDYSYDPDSVETILDIFLNRKYERDGFGGPFLVKKHPQDLRDMDLWWQMNAYLIENFPL